MSFQISPFGNQQFFDSNGNLGVGYKLFTYLAGTSTKEAVAKDANGAAFHTDPIVLNAFGLPVSPIYLDSLKFYKFVYAPPTDTDPPVSPVYTADYVGVVPLGSFNIDQWLAGTTPTFVNATQFTVVGDQTATLHIGRRVKLTNSSPASTAYGTIIVTAFGSVTTVTVAFDAGSSINSSLSAMAYGLLTASGSAWPNGYNIGLDTLIQRYFLTDIQIKKANPAVRLIGTEGSAKDYLVQEISGELKTFVNTGSELVPTWTEDNFFCKPGFQIAFAGSVIPGGWLSCDGTAVSRTTYARLFAVISTTYGVGDGLTTFNVPDKRGRASIGSGTGSGLTNRVQGVKLGEENHAQTLAENGPHTHSDPSALRSGGGMNLATGAGADFSASTTGSSGSGTGHNTMQPSEVDLWVIKY